MTKKETRIDLNDTACSVELEPLKQPEDDTSPLSRHRSYCSGTHLHGSPASGDVECARDCEESCNSFFRENRRAVAIVVLVVLLLAYTAYFVAACWLDFTRARSLFIITMFAIFCIGYTLVSRCAGDCLNRNVSDPCHAFTKRNWWLLRWFVYATLLIALGCWLGFDTAKEPRRLVSFGGLLVYILIGYLLSNNKRKVNWRPVIWGFAMQLIFGILILRTHPGRSAFKWFGDIISAFIACSDEGAKFLFGDLSKHPFAFRVLPVVVFFSAFIYTVYYLGVMQLVIKKIASLMQVTLGTSAAESLNAAGNIFIGQTEAPLLIRPFLADVTMSELHAIMTGGFATIAGSVLGAFISFGISPTHLLSASVMSAPAALALSKLMYPETEEPHTKKVKDIKIPKGQENSVIEALAVGASMSIGLVANIAVNLIAFVALLAVFNGLLTWGGSLVGIENLTFQYLSARICMPFAYLMGVDWDDAFKVGELLGIKTFLNEFVAYIDLSQYVKTRLGLTPDGPSMSMRSEVIATYALCGFANFASVGIQIGGISALVPQRRSDIAKLALRAMFAGTIACFMTACVAGMLYEKSLDDTTLRIRIDPTSITTAAQNLTTMFMSSVSPTTLPITFASTTPTV